MVCSPYPHPPHVIVVATTSQPPRGLRHTHKGEHCWSAPALDEGTTGIELAGATEGVAAMHSVLCRRVRPGECSNHCRGRAGQSASGDLKR